MTHLRKAMLEELQRRNLSQITIRIYLRAVEEFAQYFKMSPDRLRPEHIRQYQAHLFTDRKLDAISVAQQLSALRFFFLKTLKRPWMVEDMPFPKRSIRLPQVLSQEEVERLIQCAGSPLASDLATERRSSTRLVVIEWRLHRSARANGRLQNQQRGHGSHASSVSLSADCEMER